MVARKPDAESDLNRLAQGVFGRWQRFLGTLAMRSHKAAEGLVESTRRDRGKAAENGWLALGLACLLGGAIIGIVLASPGPPSAAELLAGVSSILWAMVRLVVMRLSTPALATDRTGLRRAWALGLIPWIIGVNPLLRLLAWFISGAVTLVALRRRAAGPRAAGNAVLWAWGSQGAIAFVAWLLRNLLVAVAFGAA